MFEELFAQVVERVIEQRFGPDISGLRTPIYLAEFVHIKIATASPTFEWGGTISDKALAIIGKIHTAFRQRFHDLFEHFHLIRVELELAFIVVDKEHARCETHFRGKSDHLLGLLWRRRADDTADSHAELRVLPQPHETFLEIVEHLLGSVIGMNAIDRNLHLLKSGLVQRVDRCRLQEEPIGNHARAEETQFSAFPNEVKKVWVEGGFAAR